MCKNIAFCICTHKRPDGLRRLLQSIAKISNRFGAVIEVVVVENDSVAQCRDIVCDFSRETNISAEYFLEKKIGISNARNRAVAEASSSDFILFVDDDQVCDISILDELLRCQMEFSSDMVYGANPPKFDGEVADKVKGFFACPYQEYGRALTEAPTNCLFIRTNILIGSGLRFSEQLNSIGGEDILLTRMLVREGYKLVRNPNAIANEIVPPQRCTIEYIKQRSIRNEFVYLTVQDLLGELTGVKILHLIIRYFFKFFKGLFLLPIKEKSIQGIQKIYAFIGAVKYLSGEKIRFYN